MSEENKIDLYERIKQFQQDTLFNKPSTEQMKREVQMMNFKIRPVVGNISKLDFYNSDFLSALWSLGKLDEFFRTEAPQVASEEQGVFFKIVDEMRISLQQQLNKAKLVNPQRGEKAFVEVEIFKDTSSYIN